MPWEPSSASEFTKKANTPKRKRQWAKVADKVLKDSGDEAKAIKIANAAVKKSKKPKVSLRKGYASHGKAF